MKIALGFVMVWVLLLAACVPAQQAAQKAPQIVDNVAPYADDIARLLGLVDEATRASQAAGTYMDEAHTAAQAGLLDDSQNFLKLAQQSAAKNSGILDEAGSLAARLPEDQIPASVRQALAKAAREKALGNRFAIDTSGSTIIASFDLADNPSSELYKWGREKVDDLARGYLCLHFFTWFTENRDPNEQDKSEFARNFGINVADGLLGLEGYASRFSDIAQGYAKGESAQVTFYKGKANEYCQEFLKDPF